MSETRHDETSNRSEVPLCNLAMDNAELLDEVLAAVERVLRSGQYVLGPEVQAFEAEVAEFVGVEHAVAVASGTDALLIALEAAGVRGREVITTAWSFAATAEAIVRAGATPVFVDIEPHSLNLDPDNVKAALTSKTAAIVPVHLFGRPCAMSGLVEIAQEAGIAIVDDAAQAFGARIGESRVGSLPGCTATAFSFFPTKNLGGFGDGGMLTTHDDDVAALGRSLRQHGFNAERTAVTRVGYNSRLDALQAAALRVKMRHLESLNAGRAEVAQHYKELLVDMDGVELLEASGNVVHVFHQFPIRVPVRRDQLLNKLRCQGIQARAYYPTILPDMPAWRTPGNWPHARCASREILCLPIWATMPREATEQVAHGLGRALSG